MAERRSEAREKRCASRWSTRCVPSLSRTSPRTRSKAYCVTSDASWILRGRSSSGSRATSHGDTVAMNSRTTVTTSASVAAPSSRSCQLMGCPFGWSWWIDIVGAREKVCLPYPPFESPRTVSAGPGYGVVGVSPTRRRHPYNAAMPKADPADLAAPLAADGFTFAPAERMRAHLGALADWDRFADSWND